VPNYINCAQVLGFVNA